MVSGEWIGLLHPKPGRVIGRPDRPTKRESGKAGDNRRFCANPRERYRARFVIQPVAGAQLRKRQMTGLCIGGNRATRSTQHSRARHLVSAALSPGCWRDCAEHALRPGLKFQQQIILRAPSRRLSSANVSARCSQRLRCPVEGQSLIRTAKASATVDRGEDAAGQPFAPLG